MKQKNSLVKNLDIIFIIVIIGNTIKLILKGVKSGTLQVAFPYIPDLVNVNMIEFLLGSASMIFSILLTLLFYLAMSLLYNFAIIAAYIGIRIALKKHQYDKLSVSDFENDDYYREMLKKYSPAVLSYIDDFDLGLKDIVATLIILEKKGKIKLTNQIELIDDNIESLEKNEIYILEYIKRNELRSIDLFVFKNIVISDCIDHKLLKEGKIEQKKKKKNLFKLLWIFIVYVMLYGIIFLYLGGKPVNNVFVITYLFSSFPFLLFILFSVFIIVRSYKMVSKSLAKENPYIRTKEAETMNIKLEGLKKFIVDFSVLDERKYQEIKVWDDYLIYSVIFGQNEKVINEIIQKL